MGRLPVNFVLHFFISFLFFFSGGFLFSGRNDRYSPVCLVYSCGDDDVGHLLVNFVLHFFISFSFFFLADFYFPAEMIDIHQYVWYTQV